MHIGRYLFFVFSLVMLFNSCIDPVEPEFDFQDGLLYVDAFALSEEGTSIVTIQKSDLDRERFRLKPISDASVKFINSSTLQEVKLQSSGPGTYAPPFEFKVLEGESWHFEATLSDGSRIESSDEIVGGRVPIDDIKAIYDPTVTFDQDLNKLIPGHRVFLSLTDPEDEENHYMWVSRSFEILNTCITCERGRLREGICETFDGAPPYYSYLCDTTCWQIRHSDKLLVQDDVLNNGRTIEDKELTILPYYRREDILVEVQQISLTKSAFDYFKLIADITNNSGSLNAPPPAGLLGNLFNPDDLNQTILGQFTAASVTRQSLYIDRSGLEENPLAPDLRQVLEDCDYCPNYTPCEEGRFRTSIKPFGWPE